MSADRDPIRVLIADDDHRVRTALSRLLTLTTGFDIVGTSATTDSALTLARQHRPAVALIDILRAITDELHIPAVAMSVNGGLGPRALAAGATRFVDKDSRADLLIDALRAVAS